MGRNLGRIGRNLGRNFGEELGRNLNFAIILVWLFNIKYRFIDTIIAFMILKNIYFKTFDILDSVFLVFICDTLNYVIKVFFSF